MSTSLIGHRYPPTFSRPTLRFESYAPRILLQYCDEANLAAEGLSNYSVVLIWNRYASWFRAYSGSLPRWNRMEERGCDCRQVTPAGQRSNTAGFRGPPRSRHPFLGPSCNRPLDTGCYWGGRHVQEGQACWQPAKVGHFCWLPTPEPPAFMMFIHLIGPSGISITPNENLKVYHFIFFIHSSSRPRSAKVAWTPKELSLSDKNSLVWSCPKNLCLPCGLFSFTWIFFA